MRIGFLHQPNDIYTPVRMKYFISKNHEVYSISFPKKTGQKAIKGLKRIFLPYIFLNRIPFFKRLIYGWHIAKITRKYQLDILHIISALNSFYLFYSQALKNVLENEGSDVIKDPENYPLIKYYYKWFYKYADGIIQDSKLSQDASRQFCSNNNIQHNEVIEIGVDFNIFNKNIIKGIARNRLNLKDDPFIFHSRSFSKIYNIDTIIKSLPLVKEKFINAKYVLTGVEVELDSETLQFIKKEKLEDNIIFCGRLDHDTEIKYFYRDADVVISVPLSDSSPFSVYESMACGTPVIVSDLPWLKGKFIPNKHLITVPVKDYNCLADNIIKVLKCKLIVDLNSAYQIVLEKINMEKENSKLEMFYKSLIGYN